MKATGIVRRFDDLGRINIPREIRAKLFNGCTDGKPMEIFVDGNDIVLRKYEDAEERKEKETRNKAIDEFAEKLKPYISEYAQAIKRNRFAFIDIDEIAEQMKAGGSSD